MFIAIGYHSHRVIAQIDALRDPKLAATRKRLVKVVFALLSRFPTFSLS
jgi:hypothetical protein